MDIRTSNSAADGPISLQSVRGWALRFGIDPLLLAKLENDALEHSVACLIDALRREFPDAVKRRRRADTDTLSIGSLDFDVARSGPFTPAPLIPGVLWLKFGRQARLTELLLELLPASMSSLLPPDQLRALKSDFANSVANLLLNRLLYWRRDPLAGCPEPAWQGHTYYPFPALRTDVSIEDVAGCSHLSEHPVSIPIYETAGLEICRSDGRVASSWDSNWLGAELSNRAIPIHPWHARRSRIIAELCRDSFLRPTPQHLPAYPLSSERTCRLTSTSYELKLALDVTLTGEHRLLYPQNVENAVAVSAFVGAMCKAFPQARLGVQPDIASVRHKAKGLAPYLSVIVRAPVPSSTEFAHLPALNIWSGPNLWKGLIGCYGARTATAFFRRYSCAVIRGPLIAWVRWGIGTEPHLQNSFVTFVDGQPWGLVVRDLDSTILDRAIAGPFLRSAEIDVSPATWESMPPAQHGRDRLAHALFHGHLSTVGGMLVRHGLAQPQSLVRAMEAAKLDIERDLSTSERKEAAAVWTAARAVKRSLKMRLERSMTMDFAEHGRFR